MKHLHRRASTVASLLLLAGCAPSQGRPCGYTPEFQLMEKGPAGSLAPYPGRLQLGQTKTLTVGHEATMSEEGAGVATFGPWEFWERCRADHVSSWTSSNPAVASVEQGPGLTAVVRANAVGAAEVSVDVFWTDGTRGNRRFASSFVVRN